MMNWNKIYSNLIERALNRQELFEPTEKHHAFPYHWFGVGVKKDFDWSIVKLTRKEHFIAHKLLCKIYPNNPKAKMALGRMINSSKKKQKYNVKSKDYVKYKQQFSDSVREFRKDAILDANRRKICSERMKKYWDEGRFNFLAEIRKDPIKDNKRRQICSQRLQKLNAEGLTAKTKKRNANLDHMTSIQIENMRKNQIKALSGKTQVVFLDGKKALVNKEFYKQNKGILCYHAASKKAAEILGKNYVGGRPRRKN